ncbi:unnamed protein product, partial [Penicillium egyptiacum]
RDLVVQLTTHLLAPSTSRLSRAFLTPADVRALHDHLCDAAFFASSVLHAAPDEIPPRFQRPEHLQTAI